MKSIKLFVLVLLFSQSGEALSLDEFLNKVGVQNSEVKTQVLNQESSALRANEGYLLTTPKFYLSGNFTNDRKEAQNPLFEGTQRNISQSQAGIEQQSTLGLTHKLYYGMDSTELIGVDPTFFPNPEVYRSSFNYEFTLSLWKNGLGRSTSDQVEAILQQNRAESLMAGFTQKQLRVEATVTYWKLKAAKELYTLSQEMLQNNKEFLNWTNRRVRDRLSETVDLRQAQAAYALREFEVEQAENELIEAQNAFNRILEVQASTPIPDMDKFPPVADLQKKEIVNPSSREDVTSIEASLKAIDSQSRIAAESTRPQLDLTGHLSSNGLDPKYQPSFDKSLRGNHPAYTVGIKFSVPLDRGSVNDVQKSAKIRAASVSAQLQRKHYEVQTELEALNRNYNQALKLYDRAFALERAQFEKYKVEQERRRIGRTSTFQLLSFQQEYQSARQSLIRSHSALVILNAQYELFAQQTGEL